MRSGVDVLRFVISPFQDVNVNKVDVEVQCAFASTQDASAILTNVCTVMLIFIQTKSWESVDVVMPIFITAITASSDSQHLKFTVGVCLRFNPSRKVSSFMNI